MLGILAGLKRRLTGQASSVRQGRKDFFKDILGGDGSLSDFIGDALSAITGSGGEDRAEETLNMEKEKFAYQQSFDKTQMEREDTQLQRLKADASKAGISPIAALGGAQYGQTASSVKPTASAGQGHSNVPGLMQAIRGLVTMNADIGRTQAEKAALEGKALRDQAEANRINQEVNFRKDMNPMLLDAQRLDNATVADQVSFLEATFASRVVMPTAHLDLAKQQYILGRQRQQIGTYQVEESYQAHIERQLYRAWQGGRGRVEVHLTSPDFPLREGAQRQSVVVDTGSLRYPQQVEILANQIALEMAAINQRIAKKEVSWWEVSKIGGLIHGSMNSAARMYPFFSGTAPTQGMPEPYWVGQGWSP